MILFVCAYIMRARLRSHQMIMQRMKKHITIEWNRATRALELDANQVRGDSIERNRFNEGLEDFLRSPQSYESRANPSRSCSCVCMYECSIE